MKRMIALTLAFALGLSLCACASSSEKDRQVKASSSVDDVLKAGAEAADAENEPAQAPSDAQEEGGSSGSQAEAGDAGSSQQAPSGQYSVINPNDNSVLLSGSEITPTAHDGLDIDLTQLSSTMVYSQVYDMMVDPEPYLGKMVRMRGDFAYFHDEGTGNDYYACIIQDATACCAQGIEFVPVEEEGYPQARPQEGEELTVTGVFDAYYEGEYQYLTLRNASVD